MPRILFDSHMHTPLCKHAAGDPENYAEVAERRGLRGVIFTCHNPVPNWGANVRMDEREFETYVAIVEHARKKMAGRVEVLLGLESDYAPGMEAYLEKLHARVPLNFVLGSVHPQLAEYRARYFAGDAVAFQRTYFTHLAEAAESGLFDCLSHPDLVKNMFPTTWDLAAMLDHIRSILDRIAKTGIAMELNTSGLQKAVEEMNPGPEILREMCLRNIPVVLGSDSHIPRRVGEDFGLACDLLTQAGNAEVSFFIGRKRQTVGIAEAKASLK
ncbi:MAG TPA: histidinol-phosphatase [Planctomycetota bacterium]|nr:histidinol-phosphatase [Planctomycetota bacterium]